MASERDLQDVINTLIAEGVGEGEEGMRRIAETILNRAEQRGISPAEVVRQRAQYTGYSAPGPAAVRAQSDPQSLTAAQAAWQMAQGSDDPTGGANHYWNPGIVNPSWAGSMQSLGQYGNHAFATDRAVAPRPTAPTPASQSPLMASSRAVTSPSGGNTALQNSLAAYATREGNRVTPATMQGRATTVASYPTVAQAPATRAVQSRAVPGPSVNDAARRAALGIGANQTYAGQSRAPVTAAKPALTMGAQSSFAGQDRAPTNLSQARLAASAPGLPALYGTMSQNRVNTIGVPLSNQVSPVNGLQMTAKAPTPLARPGMFGAAQPAIAARQPVQAPIMAAARAPVPVARPPMAAPVARMPLMAQRAPVQQPLNILVQGSQTMQPRPISAVQQLQAQGLSPSQAYAAANAGNTPISVYDKVRGQRDSGGSGGVQPKGTIY